MIYWLMCQITVYSTFLTHLDNGEQVCYPQWY